MSIPVYPWYDSHWISMFTEACDLIARTAPERLEEFKAAFDPLRTPSDFREVHLKDLLDEAALAEARAVVGQIAESDLEKHELNTMGRRIVHGHPHFKALQHELTERVSRVAGIELEPCYTYLCLYTSMGRCDVHLDAPSASWTLDICLEQSVAWPIHFSQVVPWPEDFSAYGQGWENDIRQDPTHEFRSHELHPGEALLFSGSSQWHYRDAIPPGDDAQHCHLAFLHYIPKGTKELTRPQRWPDLFGLPELARITDRKRYQKLGELAKLHGFSSAGERTPAPSV